MLDCSINTQDFTKKFATNGRRMTTVNVYTALFVKILVTIWKKREIKWDIWH